jgi:5'-nucleotidase / UDP-sugar diphosphatase
MKQLLKTFLWLSILLLTAPLGASEQPTVHITVLHVNDLHGHLLPFIDKGISETVPVGGAARLAKMIADERGKDPDGTVLLAAGDMFQGTPISNVFHGQPVIEVMNDLKFDAMAVGNHEFDWGRSVLNEVAEAAAFPFLAANIKDHASKSMPHTKPYVLIERNNLKLAVIGLTTPDTAFIVKPDYVSGLTFRDPAEFLPGVLKEARGDGAEFIVLLSHLGLDADLRVAEEVPGIGVIIGGHSHSAVTHPMRVNETVVVQAGSYGAYLGVLKLELQPGTGKIIDYTRENELKTVFAGPDDPTDARVAGIVDRYNDQIKAEFARVIGETSVDLLRNSYEESNVGDLVCDALKEASGADIAFQNSGAIRVDLPKGKITLEQVYTLLPFDNTVVVMDLTGDQIKQILEQNAGFEHRILQVSGLSVHYDLTKPPGSRAVSIQVGGNPLALSKSYRIAVNDFLAAGGDRFPVFRGGKNITYGNSLRDIFTTYVEKNSPLHPERRGRIVFISR